MDSLVLSELGLPGYIIGVLGGVVTYLFRRSEKAQREQAAALRAELAAATQELAAKNQEIQRMLFELAKQKSRAPKP